MQGILPKVGQQPQFSGVFQLQLKSENTLNDDQRWDALGRIIPDTFHRLKLDLPEAEKQQVERQEAHFMRDNAGYWAFMHGLFDGSSRLSTNSTNIVCQDRFDDIVEPLIRDYVDYFNRTVPAENQLQMQKTDDPVPDAEALKSTLKKLYKG